MYEVNMSLLSFNSLVKLVQDGVIDAPEEHIKGLSKQGLSYSSSRFAVSMLKGGVQMAMYSQGWSKGLL